MPRKKLIRTTMYPYHITMRTNGKVKFNLPLNIVWDFCKKAFDFARAKSNVSIHSFVLMNNHYHLLISTPDGNIDYFMYLFNKKLADQLRAGSGNTNRIFGGNYKWSLVTNSSYLFNVLRYIYQNPVRALLVERVEDYKYSTIYQEYLGEQLITSLDSPLGEVNVYMLEWYNFKVSMKEDIVIRRGLRRSKFKTSIDPNTGHPKCLSPYFKEAS